MKKYKVVGISITLFFGNYLNAIDLSDTIKHSLETNPSVKVRLDNYEKTVYDLKIAKSGYQPKVDFIGKFGHEKTYEKPSGIRNVHYNVYRKSLLITQNLFNGFSTINKIKFEEARVMAAGYNYVELTNDVAFNITRNYINVLKYKQLLDLEKENISLTKNILDKTKELTDSDEGKLSDVKKVDSSLQLAEFNFLSQKNNLMDSKFNLSKYTGTMINEEEMEEPTFNFDLPKVKENALNYSIKHNPSILVTNYNIEGAKAKLDESKSKYYPTLDFEFNYNIDKNISGVEGKDQDYSALLVVKYNLYNGQADINNVKKNRVNVKQEYEIQRDKKREIIEGLGLSWSAYNTLEKQIIFLEAYKDKSKSTLDLYQEEFEAGMRSLTDLLSAQNDYISSKTKLVSANYDLLFAKYRILDAMGELVNSVFNKETSEFYTPIYAKKDNTIDSELKDRKDMDKDLIEDEKDLCDSTPLGMKVDMFGCAIEGDEVSLENDLSLENESTVQVD